MPQTWCCTAGYINSMFRRTAFARLVCTCFSGRLSGGESRYRGCQKQGRKKREGGGFSKYVSVKLDEGGMEREERIQVNNQQK